MRWSTGLVMCLALGCGKKAAVEVEFAGQFLDPQKKSPAKQLALRFHPADESNKRGRSPTCVVEEGRFEGKCLPGRYKVTLTPILPAPGGTPSAGATASADRVTPSAIQAYQSSATTPWEVVIPPEGKSDIKFELR